MFIGKLKSIVSSTYKPTDTWWKRAFSPQTLPGATWLKLLLTKQEAGRVSIEGRMWLPLFPDRDPSKSSKIAAWGNGNATRFEEFVNFKWLVFTVNPPTNWKTERLLHMAQKTIITNGSWILWDVFSTFNCIFIQLYDSVNSLFNEKNHECLRYVRLCALRWQYSGKQGWHWCRMHAASVLGQWFQPEVVCPWGTLELFGIIFGCHVGLDGGAAGVWWIKAGMLPTSLTYRTVPTTKNYSTQNGNSAKSEKLRSIGKQWLRVLTCHLALWGSYFIYFQEQHSINHVGKW